VIGLLSTLPSGSQYSESGDQLRPAWVIDDELREQYDVRDIFPNDDGLPDKLDALLVLHPKGLSPALVRAINHFVIQGGRMLLAVDPDAQFDGQFEDQGARFRSCLHIRARLESSGIQFDPAIAVGDLDNALLVGSGRGNRPVRHLGFVGFSGASLAASDPLTSGLHRLDFATPGYFEFHVPSGIHLQPLVTTSIESAPYRVADLSFGATPETLRHGFHPTGRRYVIAARLEGQFPSAFEEDPSKPLLPAKLIRHCGHGLECRHVVDPR
jgi:ABC-type uncharacterized transport system involved in gliding motility auxiliary subunit